MKVTNPTFLTSINGLILHLGENAKYFSLSRNNTVKSRYKFSIVIAISLHNSFIQHLVPVYPKGKSGN